jgi:hypothetical protein
MADKVLTYKYVIKNTARKRGKVVTVMPKPLFQDNGSGMHTHQSLWKAGKNIFYDKKRLRADQRDGKVRHRRSHKARPCAVRLHCADDQLLQETSAGLRSADQLGLFGEKPQRLCAYPDVLHQREGKKTRV